jgi:nucleoside-diphosphate-sugar epimerase
MASGAKAMPEKIIMIFSPHFYMDKSALITGGAGFIGLHLAADLARDRQVTIVDNFARGKEDTEFNQLHEHENVSFVKMDLTVQDDFSKLDEYDEIYHLAAINGTGNFYSIPDKVLKVGVLGTMYLLDWLAEKKKGKLLFSSSSETYAGTLKVMGDAFPIPTPEEIPLTIDDPSNVRWSYGAGKIVDEVAIHAFHKAHNIDFSIIRYHNVYGPRMGTEHVIPQFIERVVKKENPFTLYGGQETRTFCYIDDAVAATRLVMQNPNTSGKTLNVGRSDEEIKIVDLARKLFDITNYHPDIDIQPAPEGSVKRRCPDITKLTALGYTPQTTLEQGLQKTFEWYEPFFSE